MSENPYESPQSPPPQKPWPPLGAGMALFVALAVVALLIAVAVVCAAA